MELMQELENTLNCQEDYCFKTDRITYATVETKGEKESYVTGYISVPEIDLENDLMTPNALKSMLRQIEESTITMDFEHESFRDDPSILPVAKIVEAKVDERGLWVKAKLNKHSPKYKALWGSVKDGFVNAFSVAFKPLKTVIKMMGDVKVRLIEELKLLNVAFTSTPCNPGAKMTGHSMKSVMLKAIEDTKEEKILVSKSLITKLMEEKSMGEQETTPVTTPVESESVPETAPESAESVAPEVSESTEAKPEEAETPSESVVEEKTLAKIVEDLKAKVEAQEKENAELKSDLKALKENEVFKSTVSDKPIMKSPPVSPLSLIR